MTTEQVYALLNKKIKSSTSGIKNITSNLDGTITFDLINGNSFTIPVPHTPEGEIEVASLSELKSYLNI